WFDCSGSEAARWQKPVRSARESGHFPDMTKRMYRGQRFTQGTKEAAMGARQKLNSAYLLGSVVLAGWIGATAQSIFVFLLALGFLVALKCYTGDIRPPKGRHTR